LETVSDTQILQVYFSLQQTFFDQTDLQDSDTVQHNLLRGKETGVPKLWILLVSLRCPANTRTNKTHHFYDRSYFF
ncbi:MAG: hypothetical protein J6Q53_03220, partial [Oscillospiraceae bacterium]|nr:hypothetical protein [Oscillospiraceae bacterium]